MLENISPTQIAVAAFGLLVVNVAIFLVVARFFRQKDQKRADEDQRFP